MNYAKKLKLKAKTTKLILLDSLLQEAEHVARLYVTDSWGSQL